MLFGAFLYVWNLIVKEKKRFKTAYDNIRKVETGQGDDYTTGWLLIYPYFRKHYKLIAIDD